MKTKTFDALKMKRHGSKKIYEATAHMTPEQQRAFWQQRTEALKKRQQAIQRKQRCLNAAIAALAQKCLRAKRQRTRAAEWEAEINAHVAWLYGTAGASSAGTEMEEIEAVEGRVEGRMASRSWRTQANLSTP